MKKKLLLNKITPLERMIKIIVFKGALLIGLTLYVSQVYTQTVSTFAGSTAGFVDATGTAAKFNGLGGMDFDSNGNLYVTDEGNSAIRKITPTGVVTTYAGGSVGFTDATTSGNAQFNLPQDLCVDASGNVYVVDFNNFAIRKITPGEVITTLAGNGTSGYVDGTSSVAQFSEIYSITIDSNGNLYVADAGCNRIRKVTPNGTVSTLAGNGVAASIDGVSTAASFNYPTGIHCDVNNVIYVSDYLSNKIRKIDVNGNVTTIAGSTSGFTNGVGSAAQFNGPLRINSDNLGNVYIADNENDAIRKIDANGTVTTVAGSGTHGFNNGPIATALFHNPYDVAIDSSGNLFVSDFNNSKIRKIEICQVSTSTDVQVACHSFTWIDGNTYTSSNSTATHTLTNSTGCDSIITLNLTINTATMGTDTHVTCNSFTWIDGNTYISSNNTATHTLTNSVGCDSIITLDLTINTGTMGTDTQTACGSFTWIDGNTYTSSNNTATHYLTNSVGCDSIITLDLTIPNLVGSITYASGDLSVNAVDATSFQWIDCGNNNLPISGETNSIFTSVVNGNYAVILSDASCTDTTACYNLNNVGVSENESTLFTAYPNPTNKMVIFNTKEPIQTIEVYNLTGQKVIEFVNQNTIDISSLPNGTYTAKVIIGSSNPVIKRLIKN